VVPRRDPLPWLLLAVVVVVALAAGALLWARVSQESARADEAVLAQAKAEADLATKTMEADEATKRAEALDAQVKALTAQRDGLIDQLKALEARGGRRGAGRAHDAGRQDDEGHHEEEEVHQAPAPVKA
jgi:hypothetical protein